MARPVTPAGEARQRRRAGAYARKQCQLKNSGIARLAGLAPHCRLPDHRGPIRAGRGDPVQAGGSPVS